MTLDQNAVYRLLDVQDHQGHSRAQSRKLCRDRVGCLATGFHWDGTALCMTFVRDPAGNFIMRRLHTSTVVSLEERDGRLTVRTQNSLYLLEAVKADLPEGPPRIFPAEAPAGVLVELYFSEEGDHFCGGLYWDKAGNAQALACTLHLGMVVDTCLIGLVTDKCLGGFVCRYYLGPPDRIEFYNSLYEARGIAVPIMAHNCGTIPLHFCREWDDLKWTVEPGGRALLR